VSGAALSPDGSRVAVGCADNTVRLVDAALGKEVLQFSHHDNWVLGTAFSVDGKRIVSVGRDGIAQVNDATTGAFLENINTPHGELATIARHPERDLIVFGGAERVPYLYNLNRDPPVRTFEAQDGPIFALAFSPDGGMIAVGGAGDDLPIYQAGTGESVATCKGSRGIYAVAFSPDGQRLAAGGGDGRVRICDTKSGGLVREFAPIPKSSGTRFRFRPLT
jgi:WD40 repeat protein